MANFLLLAIVGLIAQLVDGSLGMAYGVTSQSLLLTVGIAPALASASVHIAEVGTTAASGTSHWRFGNVDWSKVWPLAIPGAIGGFFGAGGGRGVLFGGVGVERFHPRGGGGADSRDLPLQPGHLRARPLLLPAAP